MLKKILFVLLLIFVVIQFIRPAKNIHPGAQPNAVSTVYAVPADVKSILDKACLDCHSNNTRYPWYNTVQPFAWWLAHHVKEGKSHWNFDESANRSLRYQYHKMEELDEMVKDDKMPIKSYTWAHGDAKLTPDEKEMLRNWAHSIMDTMKARYPIDSLVRKN